jgi:nucleoid-associated protein YgaU
MRISRAIALLALPLALTGCGYVHFGRLPQATATPLGDTGYTNLLTEQKILKQELVLARKEGDTLRAALERGGGASPELMARLNETTRELATLRASHAKLQAGNASAAQLGEIEDKLATSLRNYTQLQDENARLRADLDRARGENSQLSAQLKSATTENQAAQGTLTQLNTELLAQKEARARAEQATAAARAQLSAVIAARDAAPATAMPAESSAAAPALSTLQLAKAPPADSSAIAELRTNPERVRNAEVATAPVPPPAPAPKAARLHVVQAGETLEKIAQKYYGDAKRWVRIYTVNNDTLRDGRPLKPGMELEIPEN